MRTWRATAFAECAVRLWWRKIRLGRRRRWLQLRWPERRELARRLWSGVRRRRVRLRRKLGPITGLVRTWGLLGLLFWGWVRARAGRVPAGMIVMLMAGMVGCGLLPMWIICLWVGGQ